MTMNFIPAISKLFLTIIKFEYNQEDGERLLHKPESPTNL